MLMKVLENSSLFLVEERIKTYKNWPFSDKNMCNVRNMAEAGFYSIATGTEDADAAKCFLCGKELDGWEADDDPWTEHTKHAAKCAFVQLGKKEDSLLLTEFISVIKQYMVNDNLNIAMKSKDKIDASTKEMKLKITQKIKE